VTGLNGQGNKSDALTHSKQAEYRAWAYNESDKSSVFELSCFSMASRINI